jgi:hypothetical protein
MGWMQLHSAKHESAEGRANTAQTLSVSVLIERGGLERYEMLSQRIDSMRLAKAIFGSHVVQVKQAVLLGNSSEKAR